MVSTKNNLSVLYAAEIQKGLLPKARHFKRLGLDYGIIWQPHSVLSGDFYWISFKDNAAFLAIADCTGHGISASLLTIMGIGLLNYIVLGKNFPQLGDYLKEIDKKWIETFQAEEDHQLFNNDWMEIVLIKIDLETHLLEISSAMLPAIIKKHTGEIITTKFNKFPIGGWQIEKERHYFSETYQMEKNDELYLFTDGIIDEFGGNQNKKFTMKNLISLIKTNEINSMRDKIQYFKEIFKIWVGDNEPIDDKTLIGLKF